MIRHFFIDKSCTLVKNNEYNTGKNPVLYLYCGKELSRCIIHFNEEEIIKLIDNKTFCNTEKLTCTLKMTNCFSVDKSIYNKKLFNHVGDSIIERASSFNLILFRLPQRFDAGRGFDFNNDFWKNGNNSLIKHGACWYFSEDGTVWASDKDKVNLNDKTLNWKTIIKDKNLVGGIYTDDFIKSEIEKYNEGEESVIITKQHFDYGNEDLSVDITDYIHGIIENKYPNYGIGIAFSPEKELNTDKETIEYVGFFNNNTNTFYNPYIEVEYLEYINDDRRKFYLNKENNLYLYSVIDGNFENLDALPKCFVENIEYEVKQVSKGIYSTKIKLNKEDFEEESILVDKWTNIKYNGEELDDVEMEFDIKPLKKRFNIGKMNKNTDKLIPNIYGINDNESLNFREKIKLNVDFKVRYSNISNEIIDKAEYRIYSLNGENEVTLIDFTPLEMCDETNFFYIFTDDFVPGKYFIDIRTYNNNETLIYKNILRFQIKND